MLRGHHFQNVSVPRIAAVELILQLECRKQLFYSLKKTTTLKSRGPGPESLTWETLAK